MQLGSLIQPGLIFPDLPAVDRPQLLRVFAERIAARGLTRDIEELYRKLWEREELGSTAIGLGIAIPHCKLPNIPQGVVAIGIVPEGVDFGAADGRPVRLFFLVISPSQSAAEHLQVLAAISRWVKAGQHVDEILQLRNPEAIYDFVHRETR